MGYRAKILADSLSEQDIRLTSMEVTFPRYILPEFNTHRVFSRNSASSRAVPVEKRILQVIEEPVTPLEWGINKAGMQSVEVLKDKEALLAEESWLIARDQAVLGAVALMGGADKIKDEATKEHIIDLYDKYGARRPESINGVHKQFVNRLLEPFMWHTVVVSSTEWDNFYGLRLHPDAQPEIRRVAQLMKAAMMGTNPELLTSSEWHVPFVLDQEKDTHSIEFLSKIAVARCARVSYETHDTGKIDYDKDIALHDSLLASGHMSPFEHIARPMTGQEITFNPWSGNFRGWHQYRKEIPNEDTYQQGNL
jgi:thymidylate synthase ThyX